MSELYHKIKDLHVYNDVKQHDILLKVCLYKKERVYQIYTLYNLQLFFIKERITWNKSGKNDKDKYLIYQIIKLYNQLKIKILI